MLQCYKTFRFQINAILIFLIIKDSWKILNFHINTTGINPQAIQEVKEFVSSEEIWKKLALHNLSSEWKSKQLIKNITIIHKKSTRL